MHFSLWLNSYSELKFYAKLVAYSFHIRLALQTKSNEYMNERRKKYEHSTPTSRRKFSVEYFSLRTANHIHNWFEFIQPFFAFMDIGRVTEIKMSKWLVDRDIFWIKLEIGANSPFRSPYPSPLLYLTLSFIMKILWFRNVNLPTLKACWSVYKNWVPENMLLLKSMSIITKPHGNIEFGHTFNEVTVLFSRSMALWLWWLTIAKFCIQVVEQTFHKPNPDQWCLLHQPLQTGEVVKGFPLNWLRFV